jgi:hypothetical protein
MEKSVAGGTKRWRVTRSPGTLQKNLLPITAHPLSLHLLTRSPRVSHAMVALLDGDERARPALSIAMVPIPFVLSPW